jgi:hypothetical protein
MDGWTGAAKMHELHEASPERQPADSVLTSAAWTDGQVRENA